MFRKPLRSTFAACLLAVWCLSVAAAPDPLARAIEHGRFVDALALDGQVFHVQGLVLDGTRVWITSIDPVSHRAWLHLFDRRSGRFLRRIDLTDGARYHPGGISLSGRSLWVPVAEPRPDSSAVLVEIDADNLQVRRRIRVADHLGCVAASGNTLVAGNWDSRLLYIFDLAAPGHPRIVANPSATQYQDIKFVGGQLVAGGTRGWFGGSVDWLAWPSLRVVRSLRAGTIGGMKPMGRGGPATGEGMAIEGRDLYLLPEDGPSHVYHFRLDAPARA